MLKCVNKVFQFFTWVLVFIITIFIFFSLYNFASVKIMHKSYTNFCGYSIFEVISGSMSPTIEVNDLILVKNTKNVKKNDIITPITINSPKRKVINKAKVLVIIITP